jgi:threonine synthase
MTNTGQALLEHTTVSMALRCLSCGMSFGAEKMMAACASCGGALEYVFDGHYDGFSSDRDDLWRFFDFIPLSKPSNIVSLGVGNSEIIALEELSAVLRGAKLYLKLDTHKNPTGTFKDREASIIISKCREEGLDNLVFYSTANTGRSYTHYAAQLNLTTYFFMPTQCAYKNTQFIRKNKNNFIILVDADYPDIGPYAKAFAKANNLNSIAPLHDRTESYTTVAYEQFQQMPQCDVFVQTIASGMGPIGFLRGHKNLVKFGLEGQDDIPRIVCVQPEETNAIYKAYMAGKQTMTKADLPTQFPDDLFEPTLNSTNPVNNYPSLYQCLNESNGIITDANPAYVIRESKPLVEALERRKLPMRFDLEKSLLIGYAGIVRLAEEGRIGKNDQVMLLGTGRGQDPSNAVIEPDLTITPSAHDPVEVKRRLDALLQR